MWLLALLIGTSFVVGALYGSFTAGRRLQGMRRVFGVLGGILLATGGVAFFSTMLASLGVIPASFEWPVGRADQIIQMQDGLHAVTHTPSGRIQVYDPAWHFVRAWNVDAAGGVFKAKLTPTGLLEVWTSRGQKRFLFAPDGRLVEAGSYSPSSYSDFLEDGAPGYVSTPFPLWIFAHPFVAWLVGVIGMAMLATSDSKRFKFKRTQQTRSI
ncbi:MAG TPA: hypothetical protein VHQ95_24860 [Pyrinomonadaceae bacterium]|nr:hypothetical protein [Pyrinomonadaceae bacterium]